jgi:hypothetical protein
MNTTLNHRQRRSTQDRLIEAQAEMIQTLKGQINQSELQGSSCVLLPVKRKRKG